MQLQLQLLNDRGAQSCMLAQTTKSVRTFSRLLIYFI